MRSKKQINVDIGERIKLAREKKHLTQESLAEAIDVSTQYISDLERGVVGASLSTLKSICVTLGVTSDSLLFGTSNAKTPEQITTLLCDLPQRQLELLEEIIRLYIRAVQDK